MFDIYGNYTSAKIYAIKCDNDALAQIYDLCNHPVYKDAKIRIMPDVHSGVGCTVGTTVSMTRNAVIPSIVGADIGCGVLTVFFNTDNDIDFKALDNFISEKIPYGMAIRKNAHKGISSKVRDELYGLVSDLKMYKSESAFLRSIGTLGGGNHYIEIGRTADGKFALSVHSGSRGIGKCVAECFSDLAKKYVFDKGITGIKRSMPYIENENYELYLKEMERCVSFAALSRKLICEDILNFLELSPEDSFDTIHNYIERHRDGSITVRKGAVSAKQGERLVIPINMRDGVLFCEGLGNADWNFSAPHGAGRLLSRTEAKVQISLDSYKESMSGINTWSVMDSTVDESPMAYKPMAEILLDINDTVRIVDIIKPLYNFKARSLKGI